MTNPQQEFVGETAYSKERQTHLWSLAMQLRKEGWSVEIKDVSGGTTAPTTTKLTAKRCAQS